MRHPVVGPKALKTSREWNTYDLKAIGHGVSGLVLVLDDYRVVKKPLGTPRSFTDIEVERQIFRRFTQHDCPFVVKCYDFNDSRGIILERLKESLRVRLKREADPPTTEEIWKWALHAAHGLAFVHENNVIQGDVGCHNMLLDAANNLKLCDFSGSSIDGIDVSIDYETRSQLLSSKVQPTALSDIFALGSALYEMATGKPPYHDKTEYQVLQLYNEGQFPDYYPVDRDQRLWEIIKACWNQKYITAHAVISDIIRLSPVLPIFMESYAERTIELKATRQPVEIVRREKPNTKDKEISAANSVTKEGRRQRTTTRMAEKSNRNIFQQVREAITTRR